jgi:drug/metabolite transporter (DMT)-like permease
MKLRALLLTTAALFCFAGNSLLCRLALAERHIDAASFTAIRLGSGALVLLLLARPVASKRHARWTSWISAAALFAYAAPFSYAYLRLGAAMGALLLFGFVQATMLGWALIRGERPDRLTWTGIVVALIGLIALTAPGRSAPDPLGAAGMGVAGIAWGIYSVRGRAASNHPLQATASNFARSVPFALILIGIAGATSELQASTRGIVLAIASGALASGLGYAIWYSALPSLSATLAAVVQLLVPVLAAAGGVLVLGETLSVRLVTASAAILGGLGLAIHGRVSRRQGA